MVKKMTPLNKALVQNWTQLAAMDDDEALIRVLTQRQIGALVAMCEYLSWKTRYDSPPDQDVLDGFSAETEFNLTDPVQICALIIECIETDQDVKNALAQWFSDAVDNDVIVQQALQRAFDPGKGGSEIPDEYANQNQYGQALGCDNDDGWGHIRDGLINRSFQRVIDVLERIEFVTDNQEMLAEFLNAIPGVGAFFDVIPVTDWVLWFDNVRAWMKEAFEAADTTDLRDEIACDLFCIWQQDCSLSVEQIRRYYWDKTEALVPSWDGAFESFSSLGAALSQFSEVSFGDAVIYALVGSQYGFLTFINDWFGIHVNVVGNDLALGEPSDDWELLCDVCPEAWEHTFDFTIDEQGFTAPYGTYSSGIGWVSGEIEAGLYYTAISINRTVATSINYFKVVYDMDGVTGEPQTDRIWVDSDISDNYLDTATNADGTDRELEWEGDDRDITAFGFTAAASACVGAFCGGEVVVKSITLRGFGTNPFI